jgi:putative nucleotidyltransferase with HDIG domain
MSHRNAFFTLFTIFFCMLLIGYPLFSQEDVAKALYEEGLRKYILQDYSGALEDFGGALQLQPDNQRIVKMYLNTLIKQGNREYEAGNLKRAEQYFLQAYKLSEEDAELSVALQAIRTQLEKEEELRETAETALQEREPEEAQVVQLPFDVEAFIQQQNEQNRLLLDKMAEAQRRERESLLRDIEENQQILNETFETQREERKTLYRNLAETKGYLDESLRTQQAERERLLQDLDENRRAFDQSAEAQRRERIALLSRIEENERVLEESMRAQRDERDRLLQSVMEISRAQREDRRMFSRTIMILMGGGVFAALIVLLGFLMLLRKRTVPLNQGIYYEPPPAVEVASKNLLEYGAAPGDRRYPALGIRQEAALEGPEETVGALSYSALLQFARMSDAKTGRLDHSVRVADIAYRIAAVLNEPDLNPEEVRRVGLAHDIGYLELDDHLLRKEGKLTERQFNIVKTHADCGLHLLQHVDLPEIFVHGIKHHHERLDGTGYPEGLKGGGIPKIARLLALADFFDAITSARPHRPAMTVGSGLKMMETMTNVVFDPEIYSILKGLYEEHTNGLS